MKRHFHGATIIRHDANAVLPVHLIIRNLFCNKLI
nr:MAG TPA: hypothetical protein [Caudoviricetes sp.]